MLKDESLQRTEEHKVEDVKLSDGGFKLSFAVLSFLLSAFFFLCHLSVLAQDAPESIPGYTEEPQVTSPQTLPNIFGPQTDFDRLFSPSVGQVFYNIAREITDEQDSTEHQVEQAVVLLTATTQLDSRARYVLPDMIKLICELPSQSDEQGYYNLVLNLLIQYTDESTDFEVAKKAIQYLLDKLDNREKREALLTKLLKNLGNKNAALGSELATLLGILMAEKTDLETASSYFIQAYDKNKYNKLAFAKLTELLPEQAGPVMQLEFLRLSLDENPFSMESALTSAQYAESLQIYEMAMGMYEYCADLFKFLYPSEPLPSYIYLPWAISCYNTQRDRHKCLQIASQLRQSGRFDLFLEAIAGRAAAKVGDIERANRIFQEAEDKAKNLIAEKGLPAGENEQISAGESTIKNQVSADSLAWFYCFARQDADKAVEWANKAYSSEPNSATAAAILAYSLVINGQKELAKSIIENYERNQIADLALAYIQLEENQKDSAIETLKTVITADPGSLEAERAREILAQLGDVYITPIDPDIVLSVLRSTFGEAFVPTLIRPEKIISVHLDLRGGKFSFDSEFSGTIIITNNSTHPLVISNDGLFKGNIRVDANISGDLNIEIPKLVSKRIRPALFIDPGKSILIPLDLFTSELLDILITYPQASVDIEFTCFIDPVITDEGKIINSLAGIEPVKEVVKRPGLKLTGRYLQNRLDSLAQGKQNQRIRIIKLFISLLMEQHAMANREPLYKFMYAEWMPDMLKSALLHGLADEDWIVKVHTMAGIFSLPMDYELINAVAENLNDTHWPVRLMAMYLLAKTQDSNFNKVLDWSARYDQNELVRRMAVALGAVVPQAQEIQLAPETTTK